MARGPSERYSNEHCLAVLRLLALRLWRSPTTVDWREHGCRPKYACLVKRWNWDEFLASAGLPPPVRDSRWAHGGNRMFWTDERVIAGMRAVKAQLGFFPEMDRLYWRLKREKQEPERSWPPARRIFELGGSNRGNWRRAMIKAGLVQDVSGWRYSLWQPHEIQFLLEKAGHLTLKRIAFHLGRSYDGCKRKLYDLGTRARDARGWYTAAVLAQELSVPVSRVLEAIHEGRLVAHRPQGRPYYQIDPESVDGARGWLTRPRITHKRQRPNSRWTRRTRGGRSVAR